MPLAIQLLRAGDRSSLDHVAPGVFDHDVDPQLATEFLADERHHMVVAIDDGRIVGFASGVHYVHPDKPAEMWINEVGVAPSHQRRGVGKALIRAILQHAERLGCREAWVLTDRTNAAAMRLYGSTGGRQAPNDQVMFTYFLDDAHGDKDHHPYDRG